jgi:DDE family transposase
VHQAVHRALDLYDRHVGAQPAHGNQRLNVRGVLALLLSAAFEPAVRSLRTIDDLSLCPDIQKLVGVPRVARSTLSDALAKFDPASLNPTLEALKAQLPQLQRFDPHTAQLIGKILAGDGSWFNLAGQVDHALHCARGNKGKQSRVRLNLQLNVDGFYPDTFDVSGNGDGCEADAFKRNIQPDSIYLIDRNFVNFSFLNAVLAKGSHFVLRLKKKVNFAATQMNALSQEDISHGVLRDEIGLLTGPKSAGNGDARSCSDKPPAQTLRRVTVFDPNKNQEVELLTDLLDVPAFIIGVLYRLRWQIELYFRWLKVLAGFRHLISQSENGVRMQFYIGVLVALLIHLQTSRRVSKYAMIWVGWVQTGRGTPEAMAQALARHDRERENDRKRRAAKKAK